MTNPHVESLRLPDGRLQVTLDNDAELALMRAAGHLIDSLTSRPGDPCRLDVDGVPCPLDRGHPGRCEPDPTVAESGRSLPLDLLAGEHMVRFEPRGAYELVSHVSRGILPHYVDVTVGKGRYARTETVPVEVPLPWISKNLADDVHAEDTRLSIVWGGVA
jgi:hypothetical protein